MAGFFQKLFDRVANRAEVDWDQLEADLIAADLGHRLTAEIIDELQAKGRKVHADDVVEVTRKLLVKRLPADAPELGLVKPERAQVILIVGVNGTGKTTSAAKLGYWLRKRGRKVMLAAADTFRAAAVEQLELWGKRLELEVVSGHGKADPSSVCYRAHELALIKAADYLICDTAGRLHTRHNLMEELTKIRRTLAKQDPTAPHLSLLVVDATTGLNALRQVEEFHKACPLNGLIVTKLDGSGKGGVVLSIYEKLGLAPLFIGTGEDPNAFGLFEAERFVAEVL